MIASQPPVSKNSTQPRRGARDAHTARGTEHSKQAAQIGPGATIDKRSNGRFRKIRAARTLGAVGATTEPGRRSFKFAPTAAPEKNARSTEGATRRWGGAKDAAGRTSEVNNDVVREARAPRMIPSAKNPFAAKKMEKARKGEESMSIERRCCRK